jgi:segregation and condensation protein A
VAIISGKLRRLGRATFRGLTADCAGTYEVVARFLALLDLYRDGAVSFEQLAALGELYITWTGTSGKEGEEK